MLDLLGSHTLATVLLATWGTGTLGLVALATGLLRDDRRVVASDPHEAAIFAALRSRV
jgi:hypothetical protein